MEHIIKIVCVHFSNDTNAHYVDFLSLSVVDLVCTLEIWIERIFVAIISKNVVIIILLEEVHLEIGESVDCFKWCKYCMSETGRT